MHVYPCWNFSGKNIGDVQIFAHPGDLTRLVKDQKSPRDSPLELLKCREKQKTQELIRNKMYRSELGYFEVLQEDYMRKNSEERTVYQGKYVFQTDQVQDLSRETFGRASPVTVVCRTKSNNCDVQLSSEVVSSTLMSCSLFSQDKEKSRLHALKTLKMYSTSQRLIFKATPRIHRVYEVEDFSRPRRGRCCFSPVYVRSNSHGLGEEHNEAPNFFAVFRLEPIFAQPTQMSCVCVHFFETACISLCKWLLYHLKLYRWRLLLVRWPSCPNKGMPLRWGRSVFGNFRTPKWPKRSHKRDESSSGMFKL